MRTTYVYDPVNDRMVEKGTETLPRVHHVMSDIEPYKSMIDGHMVTSRSDHRMHLRDHGCIEVGNETMSSAPPVVDGYKRKRLLADQINSSGMTDRDADRMIRKIREGMY